MVLTTDIAVEKNMVTSFEETVGKRVFYLEGFIDNSETTPKIFKSSENVPDTARPFKLKLVTIIGEKFDKGIFMLCNISCRVIRHRALIFEVIPVSEISKPLRHYDQIYIWNFETSDWIDATLTTSILEENFWAKAFEQTEKWAILSTKLRKLGFSDTYIRKLFRHYSWAEIEEIAAWTYFLKANEIKKSRVNYVLKKATASKYLADCFGHPCNSFVGAKKALELYVDETET